MKIEKIGQNSQYEADITSLANEVFPPNELIAPFRVSELFEAGFEIFVAKGDDFLGFAAVKIYKNLAYLAFLAISPKAQNKGIGTAILRHLAKVYQNHTIVAEIENPNENLSQNEQILRQNRLKFYSRAGFSPSGNFISYLGVSYMVIYLGQGYDKMAFREMFDKFGQRANFTFNFI